jgi:hypothetical protein
MLRGKGEVRTRGPRNGAMSRAVRSGQSVPSSDVSYDPCQRIARIGARSGGSTGTKDHPRETARSHLFRQALNLRWPWYVVRSEFDAAARKLDLYLDFEAGGAFRCPECGREGCKAYDAAWPHVSAYGQMTDSLHSSSSR